MLLVVVVGKGELLVQEVGVETVVLLEGFLPGNVGVVAGVGV